MKWLPTILFNLSENLSGVILKMPSERLCKGSVWEEKHLLHSSVSRFTYISMNFSQSSAIWFFFLVVTLPEIHTKEEEKVEYLKQIFYLLWSVNVFCGHQECAITHSKPACQRACQCVRFPQFLQNRALRCFPSVKWTIN